MTSVWSAPALARAGQHDEASDHVPGNVAPVNYNYLSPYDELAVDVQVNAPVDVPVDLCDPVFRQFFNHENCGRFPTYFV